MIGTTEDHFIEVEDPLGSFVFCLQTGNAQEHFLGSFDALDCIFAFLDVAVNRCATASQEQSVKNALELLVLSLAESPATQRSKRVEAYTQLKHRRNITGQIKTYLQENLEKEITLEQLSRQFSYSPASIRRIFKAETGHTVMAYLTDLRMAKAKALLKENHLSIEAVATAVGYANLYYFSNAFKHKFGKSPSQYRKDL